MDPCGYVSVLGGADNKCGSGLIKRPWWLSSGLAFYPTIQIRIPLKSTIFIVKNYSKGTKIKHKRPVLTHEESNSVKFKTFRGKLWTHR